ncbi:MAG: hypothetical protein N2205_09210, partial [Candidatus Caldatribacterium sp.]|nr:hypothetical protein [Candidatus Caldatribacterium sp.]
MTKDAASSTGFLPEFFAEERIKWFPCTFRLILCIFVELSFFIWGNTRSLRIERIAGCLLYTSDAADE